MLDKLENPPVTLALGTLLHDVGKPADVRAVAGPHPIQRSCRGRHEDGRGDLQASAVFGAR